MSRTLIMTFRAIFIAWTQHGLPMVLSAAFGRQKYSVNLGGGDVVTLEIIFYRIFNILRDKENLYFIRI